MPSSSRTGGSGNRSELFNFIKEQLGTIKIQERKILKDLEKSLKSKCTTRTYEKNKSYYMNFKQKIRVICLINLYHKFKVHVV